MSSSPDQEENYMYFYLIFMLILGVGLIVFSLVIWYYKIDIQSKYLLSSINNQEDYLRTSQLSPSDSTSQYGSPPDSTSQYGSTRGSSTTTPPVSSSTPLVSSSTSSSPNNML